MRLGFSSGKELNQYIRMRFLPQNIVNGELSLIVQYVMVNQQTNFEHTYIIRAIFVHTIALSVT